MSDVYDIAEEFIQLTSCSVFITGKAGTGKTTLLRRIQQETHKQVAVVAPTGVAAINAGGTTIHSFFQLPFSPFVPTAESRKQLIAGQHVNDVRRGIFRALELLIIDEVSMVRADILDAIDTVLRHYRFRPNDPFGGVQVVFIGDMYQLPPVCVGDESQIFRAFYQSPYFFHSKVIEQQPPFYIELDHIFRQSNQQFINLLNEVRNNTLSYDSLDLMNLRFMPKFRAVEGDGYITLTTHNASADAINDEEISKIDAPYITFNAKVTGDFPEKLYPTDLEMKLKVGAKVMFIANDMAQPRRYFNGKLGVVSDINKNEIWVICDGETEPIPVGLEAWENKSYTINKKTNKVEEKLLGTFIQVPLRLAWAITIHKSQGLTFDNVVIDAAAAFASGQVYVALSRCRSLDGIVLTSKINPSSLAVDNNIIKFVSNRMPMQMLREKVDEFKSKYSVELLCKLFAIEDLKLQTSDFVGYVDKIILDFNPETKPYIDKLQELVNQLYRVGLTFQGQLLKLSVEQNSEKVSERVTAAANYYCDKLQEIVNHILTSPAVTDSKTEGKDFVTRLSNVFLQASMAHFLIDGISGDYSVTNYFAVKQRFVVPEFKIKAYVLDKENTAQKRDKLLVKSENIDLYKQLASWRREYCEEHDIPVYTMLQTATLIDVSNLLPQSESDLARIKGFGKVKISRFGQECLAIVAAYCHEKGIGSAMQNVLFEGEAEHNNSYARLKKAKVIKDKTPTHIITQQLLEKDYTLQQVAEERNLSISTIYSHLAKLVHEGRVDMLKYIDEDVVKAVMTELEDNPSIADASLHELFNHKYSFGEIKVIRAYQLASNK